MLLIVDLVYDEHDWFSRSAKCPGEIFVDRRKTFLRVDNEEKKIASAQRFFGRMANLFSQFTFACSKNSACIPKRERFLSARANRRDPIARDSRLIVNYRDLSADETIKERRFADIGSSDDRNIRQSRRLIHRASLMAAGELRYPSAADGIRRQSTGF